MNSVSDFDQVRQAFMTDVITGLHQAQKTIPCKWFYDETGSALFEDITKTPEYYPTRVETALLGSITPALSEIIPNLGAIIEPGSGASIKTRLLLETQPNLTTYLPIDISAEFLNTTAERLRLDFPDIDIWPMVGDFSTTFLPDQIGADIEKLVFFPGSTIGNFNPDEALGLLRNFHALAGQRGWLLIGVDTTQDADQLHAAYNDKAGITARFNKNLLVRANRELDADFDLTQFRHDARYNPSESRIEMHLVSACEQQVTIDDERFDFVAGESIFTESCHKYARDRFLAMAATSGWQLEQLWQDPVESGFTLMLFRSR
jgi:dimethylhistidine N-methyltransferase